MRYPEDRHLTQRVNARDEQAFVELYDRFAESIYRHAHLRTGGREVAEDTVSFTFMKAWEYLREPEHRIKNAKAFLFRVAHNHLVDHWRDRETKVASLEAMDVDTPAPEAHLKITADAEATEERRALHARLAELPEDARQLLLWRFVDELSIGEIARITGKSAGATYVAIHRAKRLLERKVKESRHHEQEAGGSRMGSAL